MGGAVKIPRDAEKLLTEVQPHLKNVRNWGVQEWHEELARLRKLSVDNKLNLHAPQRNTFDVSDGVGQIGIPSVLVIPPSKKGYWISPEELPVLIVNLDGADEHILDAVKHTLEGREHPSTPSRKPGRRSLSRSFDKREFDKWQNNRIVEVAELLAWRSALPPAQKRLYTDSALGAWLWEGTRDRRDFHRAKKVLTDAIAALPAILAQKL